MVMKYNLLWYIPLCLWVLGYFILPNISSGYQNIITVFSHFSLLVLLSPSAAVFYAAIIGSVYIPIQLLLLLPNAFDKTLIHAYKNRYLLVGLLILAIVISAILFEFIIQGSFPVVVDKAGMVRIRMIPFLPLPR